MEEEEEEEEERKKGASFRWNSFLLEGSHSRVRRKRVWLRLTSISSSIITDSKKRSRTLYNAASMRITLANKEA